MPAFICSTCGVEHAESAAPPRQCLICEDERQYVGWGGQRWTTMPAMLSDGYRNEIREEESQLVGIGITPSFSIGQRALLVQTHAGNVLYDCVSLLDDPTIAAIKRLGGIQAISLSHPHFYDAMVTWSHAFDDAPVYVPEADRQWIMRPDPVIRFWDGEPLQLMPGVTLIRVGGHFPGSAVLHWDAGADGRGALLTGDSITVVRDRRYVSFMNSYPNLIPLPAQAVQGIVDAMHGYRFDRLYGGWWDHTVRQRAEDAVRVSATRYVRQIGGDRS